MISSQDEWIRSVKESFVDITEEESDAIWEELVRDGIIDRDGKVLVRMPEGPPDWAKPGNGHSGAAVPKKAKRRRKTS